jgi:hypothetical protein
MQPSFIKVLEQKPIWSLPLEDGMYLKAKRRYMFSDPQNKGIGAEVLATNLMSRLFGRFWLGSEDVYEDYDLMVDKWRIDIKNTEKSKYDLRPGLRQRIFSQIEKDEIYYLLVSINEWRDEDCSVDIQFHECAVLINGNVSLLSTFNGAFKKFNMPLK